MTTETTEPNTSTDPRRLAYRAAAALADRLVDELTVMPREVSLKLELGGIYSVQLYFSQDPSGVMEFAERYHQPVAKDPGDSQAGVFVEVRTRIDGIEVWAWTLISREQAGLLTPSSTSATQPVPVVTPSQSADVPPAIVPVVPLADMAASTPADSQ